jgi:hypothetical protein
MSGEECRETLLGAGAAADGRESEQRGAREGGGRGGLGDDAIDADAGIGTAIRALKADQQVGTAVRALGRGDKEERLGRDQADVRAIPFWRSSPTAT